MISLASMILVEIEAAADQYAANRYIGNQVLGIDMMRSLSTTKAATVLFATVWLTGSNSVLAQSEDQIKDLLACDRIKNAEDKLECFNAVIEILKQQEAEQAADESATGDAVQRQRSVDVATPRGSDFGLSQAQIEARERANNPDRETSPKEQTFNFTHAWQDAIGKYYFLMSNGQVWKEAGGSHLVVPKRAKTIRIKRNLMGGYIAFVEGMTGRPGRVKRVR